MLDFISLVQTDHVRVGPLELSPFSRSMEPEPTGRHVVLQWMPPPFSDNFFKPKSLALGLRQPALRTGQSPLGLRHFKAIATFTMALTKVKQSKAEVFSWLSLPNFDGLFVVKVFLIEVARTNTELVF